MLHFNKFLKAHYFKIVVVLMMFLIPLGLVYNLKVKALDNYYTVNSDQEFEQVIEQIKTNSAKEVIVVLNYDMQINSDDSGLRFQGIPGKKVTITSSSDDQGNVLQKRKVLLSYELQGDITLDAVDWSVVAGHERVHFYCNGHYFETTENTEISGSGAKHLYGGGSKDNNIKGDTHITLRGSGYLEGVYGGGLDSDVSGSTYILVDDTRLNAGVIMGGGEAKQTDSGTVHGDTHINIRQGSCDSLVGGGNNEYTPNGSSDIDKSAARVFGDTYLQAGRVDANEYCAQIGKRDCCIAGSICSTVTNTHFLVYPGTINYMKGWDSSTLAGGKGALCGAGISDIVLGTTNIEIVDGDFPTHLIEVAGGGYFYQTVRGDQVCQIRNINREENAIHIICDNKMENRPYTDQLAIIGGSTGIPQYDTPYKTIVDGNMLIELKNGDLDGIKLDSYINRNATADNDWGCHLNGNATLIITGGRVCQIEGNFINYDEKNGYYSRCIIDSVGTDTLANDFGYFYHFKNIYINDSNIKIDGAIDRWPSHSLPSIQKPFYSCDNLHLNNSKLWTRDSNTLLQENVYMNNSSWDCNGQLQIHGSLNSSDSTLHCFNRFYGYEAFKSENSIFNFDKYIAIGYNHRKDNDQSVFAAVTSNNDTFTILDEGFVDKIYGNCKLNKSDIRVFPYLEVTGNFDGGDSLIRVPAIPEGFNYPDDNNYTPLTIDGTATGRCGVETLDSDEYSMNNKLDVLKTPKLGDNYTSLAKASSNFSSNEDFYLINEDAFRNNLFLKRVQDPKYDDYWMWQVVSEIGVYFDPNGGEVEASPRVLKEDYLATKTEYVLGIPDTNPKRNGYKFLGWNFNSDGSGDEYTQETSVTTSSTVYAIWEKLPEPEIVDKPIYNLPKTGIDN